MNSKKHVTEPRVVSHIQPARSAIQILSRLGGMTQALACLAEADEYERRHWEAAGDTPELTPNGISVAFVREVAADYSEWISMLDSASGILTRSHSPRRRHSERHLGAGMFGWQSMIFDELRTQSFSVRLPAGLFVDQDLT